MRKDKVSDVGRGNVIRNFRLGKPLIKNLAAWPSLRIFTLEDSSPRIVMVPKLLVSQPNSPASNRALADSVARDPAKRSSANSSVFSCVEQVLVHAVKEGKVRAPICAFVMLGVLRDEGAASAAATTAHLVKELFCVFLCLHVVIGHRTIDVTVLAATKLQYPIRINVNEVRDVILNVGDDLFAQPRVVCFTRGVGPVYQLGRLLLHCPGETRKKHGRRGEFFAQIVGSTCPARKGDT